MLTTIYDLLTLLVAYMCMMFLARYVFLEPKLKYEKYYTMAALITITASGFILGTDVGSVFLCIFVGVHICLAREEKKIWGFFESIPILGLFDGLFVPVLNVAQLVFSLNEKNSAIMGIGLYVIIAVVGAILWRQIYKKQNNSQGEIISRHLTGWERKLLYIIGILLCFTSVQLANSSVLAKLDSLMLFYIMTNSIVAFVLTITVIVLIIQGNTKNHYHEQVSKMQYNIIVTMADIIENRDENTGGHVKRTAKYVEIIAKKLKEQNKFGDILTDSYMADMIIAAPLHDMGKIHVSDTVLNKPGKLTEEEFTAMKSHTTAGRDILMQAEENLGESSYLEIAVQMATYHHEWWNGKGYPSGICGTDIPLCARIMAVADVFDALVSKRCYKDPMPLEKAYGIIREESGSHFDPDVVDAFFAAIEEIETQLAG